MLTATEMFALAAFVEGRHAQAFPSFGSEHAGAPVVAFRHIGDAEIRPDSPLAAPDAVVVQDATPLHHVNLSAGLGANDYRLINTTHSLDELARGELSGGMRRTVWRSSPPPSSRWRTSAGLA